MPLISNFRYRPEIDGLRAVAVMAVVLFHAGLGVSGGFIGVDVFFVISGFLITSLILKDLEAGKFSFANFWERRARRIIPASVVVVFATLIAGWFLLLPSDYANLGKSTVWQAVFGANFYFWRSTNYFAGPADELPLLHTWSLAVEEQFYLFVPVLLAGLFCFAKLRSRRVLLLLFGIGFSISLCVSIYLLPRMPAVTFYLLPTRAWELLCGSIIAILPAIALSRLWREALTWLALALILIPYFLYTKQTPFPGIAALPPCLGAALFIWACRLPTSDLRPPTTALLLSTRPVVFVGLISYSLYLYHWPLFAFSQYWALEPLSLGYRLGMVAAGFALAILSWKFVETPFRIRGLGRTRKAMFSYAAFGLLGSGTLAVMLISKSGYPERLPPIVQGYAQTRSEASKQMAISKPVSLSDVQTLKLPRLGAPAPAPVELVVWGDSHARAIIPGISDSAQRYGVGILSCWNSASPPVLDFVPSSQFSLGVSGPETSSAIINAIGILKIPKVLLVGNWNSYIKSKKEKALFRQALLKTIRDLKSKGCKVWILHDVPRQKVDVPKALSREILFGGSVHTYACEPESYAQQSAFIASLVVDIRREGARLIDASAPLLDPVSGRFRMEVNGKAIYYDNHHLSIFGAQYVASAFNDLFSEKN